MRTLLLTAVLLVCSPAAAQEAAQDTFPPPTTNAPATPNETTDVLGAIGTFFNGMRAADSAMVRSVLHPSARFQTSMIRNGEPMLHTGSIDQFVAAVGTPHEKVWDEKVWNVDVRIDDNLAQAWMNYAFYLGDEFSHCGVNAMQLLHDGETWKILQITDTRRTEECDLPENFQ